MSVPWTASKDMTAVTRAGRSANGLDSPRRSFFFGPEVPEEIVERDLARPPGASRVGSAEPWGGSYLPGGPNVRTDRSPLGVGTVAAEAARITVPVFVGTGEVDVVADLHAEAVGYPACRDLTLCAFPGMRHMHNFAGTRRALWRRLHAWVLAQSRLSEEDRCAGLRR